MKVKLKYLVLSPAAIAFVSGSIAIASYFVDEALYRVWVAEQFSPSAIGLLYILSCIIGFFLGIFFVGGVAGGSVRGAYSLNKDALIVFKFENLIGRAFLFLNLTVSILIYLYFQDALNDVVTGDRAVGIVLRESAGEKLNELGVSYIVFLNFPFLYAFIYRSGFTSEKIAWLASLLVLLFIIQSRGPISSLLFGLLIISFLRNNSGGLARSVVGFAVLFVAILSLFAIVQYLRSDSDANASGGLLKGIWEYYMASYNRFYYIVAGDLSLPGANTGYYILQWFWEFPVLSSVLGLDKVALALFGELPPSGFLARTNFIALAGLDWRLTAFTIFGHIYHDIGMLGPVWFCFYGFLSQYIYKKALYGGLAAVIIYPFVWWSIAEWRGYLEITRPSTVLNIFVAMVVSNVKFRKSV